MNPVLSVKDLRKVYRRGNKPFVAVDGISFDLAPGEILGLLGANGAGKTTTIQMLLSTLTYTSGSILYFGKDFSKHRSEVLQHIAFASTYVSLPWTLTICQNLEIFGYLYSLSNKQIKERMDPLLERFGILEKKHVPVSSLSSGQITRLILAKAFLVDPKIILLDEPTASLDPDVAHEVCQFLLEERDRKGLSILFTSHKMDEVAEVCDRVLFLQKGKIVANDLPENLVKSISKCRLQLVVGQGMERVVSFVEEEKLTYKLEHRFIEVEVDEIFIPEFLNYLAHTDIKYSQIKILQPTLEDYFLKMVRKR
jgi:ABC-2 type transport system ATP-binding protein